MSILDRFDQSKTPANKPDILPLYCGRSGHHLERVTQALGYDTATGQERFHYWLACPNAPHKDTPYRPSLVVAERARYVSCDLRSWAEPNPDYWQHIVGYVDCTPWPTPEATAAVAQAMRKSKSA